MEKDAIELKKVFEGLVQGFGINHARIYHTLLSSEVRTAADLMQETSVNQATTYAVLRELIEWELVQSNNTTPASYFIDNPVKRFTQQIKSIEKRMQKKRKMLEKLLERDEQELEKILFKKGKNTQTKLVNMETRKELKYREELMPLKLEIEQMIREAPVKEKGYSSTQLYKIG